jgi:hypothetical protein
VNPLGLDRQRQKAKLPLPVVLIKYDSGGRYA